MGKKNVGVQPGDKYYHKKDCSVGTVVTVDDYTVAVDIEKIGVKLFTRSMFKKWWVRLTHDTPYDTKEYVRDMGIVDKINTFFLSLLRQYGDENLEKFHRGRHLIVKYRNRIIFDVMKSKYRFTLYAHHEALTPQLCDFYELEPQEYHKNLRAKFVLNDLAVAQKILRIVVTDSIFYRK